MKKILIVLFVLPLYISAQEAVNTDITLEDIWKNYKFYAKSVPGFNFLNDGQHYTRLEDNSIKKYDLTTGDEVGALFNADKIKNYNFKGDLDGYAFSDDESQIMIKTASESIYRRSSKAFFYAVDKRKLIPIFPDGKHMYATFNPQADKVAFVYENNLYVRDLETEELIKITKDGSFNEIINGAADWVYEEEFSMAKAFWWSPDGRRIAFLRFDEREVKEFTMTLYNDDSYPIYETFKYPKVGEKNAVSSAHIFDLATRTTLKVQTGEEAEMYFPRIVWTNNPNQLVVFKMNRHQNHLQLLKTNAATGETEVLLEEKNKYYIDIHDDLRFLKDNLHFIWSSEKDGYNQLYLYNLKGKQKVKLTNGKFDVTKFYGVDEKRGLVYYQAAAKNPMEKQIYAVDLKGKRPTIITPGIGTFGAQFSSTFDYYVLNESSINKAASYTVRNAAHKPIRVIEDNARIAGLQEEHNVSPVEFFSFNTSEDVQLNGWMIKPNNFSDTIDYPVFMYLYGGPGSQQVVDSWKGQNYWWFQMLAQKGYIVACVDNRGTGARGEEFKKMTYLQLGKYETIDQIEAAKYLGSLPYTDASRIGIFGWSYGGYMSSLCLLKGNDVFKAAIAVAPVTNWKWYDTIYTERFMRTEEENPEGYKENSPVYFADQLKGNYLLVHGIADDNVHFQNTSEMANALIAANKQFDTYFYPNRNHGIYGNNARLHLYQKMTDFILEKL